MRSPLEDIEGQVEEQTAGTKTAKYLTVIGSLVAVGFVAVTTYQNAGPISSSIKTANFDNTEDIFGGRPSVQVYSTLDDDTKSHLFSEFATKFGRVFKDESEREQKYTNFQNFLQRVDERNAKEMHNQDGAVHGITRFADYSEEDFKKLLGYKAAKSTDVDKAKRLTSPKRPTATTTVDWSGTYTSDVKDQGYCGSCWAFSATEQIESDAIRLGLLTTDETLSEQQIISCDTDDYGCSGGNPLYAYNYVYSNGGVTSEAAYPYSSYYDVSGTCSKNEASTITITSYSLLSSEEDMISYVLSTGPLSVCVDASSWSSYSSGIMSTCGSSVDHCVQAVGINVEDSYWKVRNSWGTEWGESGYIRLKSGVDMCSISYIPSFVVPEAVESSARHAGGQGQHGGR